MNYRRSLVFFVRWLYTTSLPGDSKWPFHHLFRGHLTIEKGHLYNHPKKVTKNCQVCTFFCVSPFCLTFFFPNNFRPWQLRANSKTCYCGRWESPEPVSACCWGHWNGTHFGGIKQYTIIHIYGNFEAFPLITMHFWVGNIMTPVVFLIPWSVVGWKRLDIVFFVLQSNPKKSNKCSSRVWFCLRMLGEPRILLKMQSGTCCCGFSWRNLFGNWRKRNLTAGWYTFCGWITAPFVSWDYEFSPQFQFKILGPTSRVFFVAHVELEKPPNFPFLETLMVGILWVSLKGSEGRFHGCFGEASRFKSWEGSR